MAEKSYLFGHQIVFSSKRTLTDQVHGILCEEIHRGRWRVGDRLPSITDLAEESGLSRMPIQQAFEQLENEGYVRRQERVGTFLVSVMPQSGTPRGAIGILMLADEEFRDTNPLLTSHHRVQKILEAAVQIGYQIETVYLRKNDDWDSADAVGGPFSDRVKGIISLHPFPHPNPETLPQERIPLVFWGPPPDNHFPCVYGDHVYAMEQLTKKVIELGHRKIVFCPSSQYETKERVDVYFRGFELAMNEAGLPVDYEMNERLKDIPDGDLITLRELIETIPDVTAIVCDRVQKIHDIVTIADMTGRRIPDDLSVVGAYTHLRLHTKNEFSTGIQYPSHEIIKACFSLLFDMMKTRKSPVSRVLISPEIIDGDSLTPPRGEKRSVSMSQSSTRPEINV